MNWKVLWISFVNTIIIFALIVLFALICIMIYILYLMISTALVGVIIPMEYILYISSGFSIFLLVWIIVYVREKKKDKIMQS